MNTSTPASTPISTKTPTIPVATKKSPTPHNGDINNNPMVEKKYYIHESPWWDSCQTGRGNISRITSDVSPNNPNFVTTGPVTLIEIEQYLSLETSKLLSAIKLAQQCDKAGLDLNKSISSIIPDVCSQTFNNFSQDKIQDIKNRIKNKTGSYVSEFHTTGIQTSPYMNSILPVYKSTPFSDFTYTDDYVSSMSTQNDQKQLCQRYADILQMLSDFSEILKYINQPAFTMTYLDQNEQILKEFQENNILRKGLEDKLVGVYGEHSFYDDSKKFLDSTVYVSVLWTILATTTLFFIFKRM